MAPVGVILSMECADPIVEPSQAEAWWEDGLRSVMLAHFGVQPLRSWHRCGVAP